MISVQKINGIHSFSSLATTSLLLFMYSSSEHCTEDFPRPNCDAWAPGVQHVNQKEVESEEIETFANELFSESDFALHHQLHMTNPY